MINVWYDYKVKLTDIQGRCQTLYNVPPHVMTSSAMGLKFGVFRCLLTSNMKTNANMSMSFARRVSCLF